MNFDFDLNALIPFEITKYNSDLRIIPSSRNDENQNPNQLSRDSRQKLAYAIDRIGEASSKAQGLKEIITSYRKLNLNDQHRIYLMKAQTSTSSSLLNQSSASSASLVGLLKVGEKRLFVYDSQGNNHEMSPLCVLDFYIHESQQRRGFGRKLFDYMLAAEQVRVEHLAVDFPTEKCVRFLKKHYGLKQPISQTNNYVVFAGFFENRPSLFRRGEQNYAARKVEANSANPYFNRVDDLPPLSMDQKYFHRTGSVDSKMQRHNYNNQQPNFKINTVTNTNNTQQHHIGISNTPKEFLADYNYNAPQKNQPNDAFVKTNSMYEILNHTRMVNYNYNPYNPFPSLNKFGSSSAATTSMSRPPLPPRNHESTFFNYQQYTPSPPAIDSHSANNATRNLYDPFPSLSSTKTMPEFYSSPSYLNSKFRKTKLW